MAKATAVRNIRDDHQKAFLKIFNSLCGRFNRWQVWQDFVMVTAIEISNATDKQNAPERTKTYQTIISKYSDAEQNKFAELLAEVIMGMEQNPDQDFLGELYMLCELGNDASGQFFTPYDVCRCMVEISGGSDPAAENAGFFSVSDPACGAGALLIAFANLCRRKNICYHDKVLFVAQDIDLIAGLMCYMYEVHGRSVVTYADNLAEWADAAWVGSVGPFWPESVTWKWKVPDGVSVADLRDSERDLLEENRVNFMTAEYKHEYMKNGICGDGNFIDNVLGADYITHQIRENLYEIFIANKKIAYTDDGFALVAAGVFAALNRAVELHIIATDPEDDTGVYTVVIPKRADATDEQARNRQMPDIKWSAQLEGAVHSVKVNGTLRVTLNG